MDKTKVIVYSDEIFPYGWGIGRYALILAELLQKHFDIKLVGTYGDLNQGFKYIVPLDDKLGYTIWRPKKIVKLIYNLFKHKNDVIMSVHPSCTLAIGLLSSIITFNRVIVVYHGSDIYKIKRYFKLPGVKTLIQRAESIAISNYVARNLQIELNLKSTVIYNTVEDRFYKSNDNISRINDLLMVSRLDSRKGHNTVAQAVRDQSFINLNTLSIVGSGPHETIIKEQFDLLNSNITPKFLGNIADSQLFDIYQKSRFILVPSIEEKGRIEGFGLVVLEAILLGCIPIISDTGGQVEVVYPNYELKFEAGNVNQLREILKKIDSGQVDTLKILKRLQSHIKEFSRENHEKQYVRELLKCL